MKIKEYAYRKPSNLKLNDLSLLDTIVWHHSKDEGTMNGHTDYHMDKKKWSWNGYGYVVDSLTTWKVRGVEFMNAGVYEHNHHTVSCMIIGDFNKGYPEWYEFMRAVALTIQLQTQYPQLKYIKQHNDFGGTECPGRYFDLELLKFYVNILKNRLIPQDDFVKMSNFVRLEQYQEQMRRNQDKLIKSVKKLTRD